MILRLSSRHVALSSIQSSRRQFSSSSSVQYERRSGPKPWVKRKQERAALNAEETIPGPDLTALKQKTLTRYSNVMNLHPNTSTIPESDYFSNLLGLMASFDKQWQIQFETYKLFLKVVTDFKFEPSGELLQQLLPIFACRERKFPGSCLHVIMNTIVKGCPPEVQNTMLKDFFLICYTSKNSEYASKMWRHVIDTTTPASELSTRLTNDIWFVYMKALENDKDVLQSWRDVKSSRNLTELPEAIVEFVARSAARSQNLEDLNDLKASLPASVLLYTFYLRLALKKRDFDLAEKTIQEMEALKMDTQFEQRMLFDFAAMYNEPRALQMWKQLVEKHQGIDTINPHVASTALTIISAVEPETCKKILDNFVGAWKDTLTSSMMHRLLRHLYSSPATPENAKYLDIFVERSLNVLNITQVQAWNRDRKMHHALFTYWLCMVYSKPDSPPISLSWVKTMDQALRLGLYSENPLAVKQLVRLICDMALEYGVVKQEDVLGFLKTSDIQIS